MGVFKQITLIIIASIIAGCFSAMAGSPFHDKAWRRFGIPALQIACLRLILGNFFALMPLILIYPYSSGHGIKSDTDEGSSFGKLAAKLAPTAWMQNIIVRSIKGALKCLTLLPLIQLNPLAFGVGCCLLIANNVCFGGDSIIKGEPMIKGYNSEEFIIACFDTAVILTCYKIA